MSEQRYTGRRARFSGTLLGRLYEAVYVHPTRFYGDLQHRGIANWHAAVDGFLRSFPKDARLVDVGSGSRRIAPNVQTLDIAPSPGLDFVADAQALPFADESIDGLIVQMLLEHVEDPRKVVAEAWRVLKPGGRIYCEVPFLFPVHARQDFRRWTLQGLGQLCAAFEAVETGACIGPFSALSALLRRHLSAYGPNVYAEAALDLMLGWALSPLKWLDRLLPAPADAHMTAGGLYLIGQKVPDGA